ncbi:flagellar hook-basal body complex protein [Haloimpatiens sp. FM7315]|uniref:flagellar hook-basal body complex protein n=1 Tax=Haloimpatiens sp. FM7315 TaxID=3298609 RepID=UPI0035A267D2
MLRSFWNSKTAMNAFQDKLEMISNNMNNVNTVGYKKVDMGFQDLLQESLDRNGYPVSRNQGKNLQTGTGVKTTSISRNQNQGFLRETGRNTDFAIDGEGMFKIYLSDGTEAYTRSGNFNINTNGKLVDASGYRVSITDDNGNEISDTIKLNRDNFNVDEKGNICQNKGVNSVKIGNIGVYTSLGNGDFMSVGKSLYKPVNNQVKVFKSNDFSLIQNFEELSNVKLEEEMSELIMTQRAFQINSQALKTADEMWGMSNNLRR